jgi:hypothetical protein
LQRASLLLLLKSRSLANCIFWRVCFVRQQIEEQNLLSTMFAICVLVLVRERKQYHMQPSDKRNWATSRILSSIGERMVTRAKICRVGAVAVAAAAAAAGAGAVAAELWILSPLLEM